MVRCTNLTAGRMAFWRDSYQCTVAYRSYGGVRVCNRPQAGIRRPGAGSFAPQLPSVSSGSGGTTGPDAVAGSLESSRPDSLGLLRGAMTTWSMVSR